MRLFTKDYRKIWIGSDFHLNHDRDFIWSKRGFNNVSDHDSYILGHMSNIDPQDVLIYLGDFSLMSTDERTMGYFRAIRAKQIFYIDGNHESYTKRINFDGTWLVHWGKLKEISIDKQHIVLCHFPLAVWNHGAHGAFHFHGHSHGSYAPGLPENTDGGKLLDVGVEVALKAVNRPLFEWNEVKKILDNKQIVKKDHHG